MSVIAVAGGTGKVGRAIVDALNATGKFTILVLGREASKEKAKDIGAEIIAVNYSDIEAIARILESNKVDTVISTIDTTESAGPELALIAASEKASTTKRYIPSVWGVPFIAEQAAIFPPGKNKLETQKVLATTSLEHTTFYNGYFADYWVLPKVKSYQTPLSVVIDIANDFAAIPGSGDVPGEITHTWDIAKFVAAYVQNSVWEKEAYIIGDKITWNEFVKIAEEAKGIKFTVVHDSIEKLKTGQITELPSHPLVYPFFPKQMVQGFLSVFGLFFDQGAFDLKPAHTLNEEFPQIKARTIRELVNEAWKKS